jgi:hypothetical protein
MHPLPHPVPELARGEHLDARHPGENPARQFLGTGGLRAELQCAVPALPQCLARVPHSLADIGGHFAGEEQAHLSGFVRLADAERVFEEGGGVEASRAREVLPDPCERTAAGQGKGLRAPGGCIGRQQVPLQRKSFATSAPGTTCPPACRSLGVGQGRPVPAGRRRASIPTSPEATWTPPRITKTCSRIEKRSLESRLGGRPLPGHGLFPSGLAANRSRARPTASRYHPLHASSRSRHGKNCQLTSRLVLISCGHDK